VGRNLPQLIHETQRSTVRNFALGSVLLCVVACSSREAQAPLRKSPLESGIARELTEKLGVPVTTRCVIIAGVAMCRAWAGTVQLPLVVENHRGEWTWQVQGRFVATAPIATQIAGELADLGVQQTVDCGAAVARVDDRFGCKLSGGGSAFVAVGSDGTVSLELAIDPAAAGVRNEEPRDLTKTSRALDRAGKEEEEEEATPGSAGSSTVAP
jgi:hypothetical protein